MDELSDAAQMKYLATLAVLSIIPSFASAGEAAIHHRDFQTPNEAVVIAKVANGETVFDSAGLMEAGGPSAGPETIFEIGSITKVFTGILLADAVLAGKASLDDPVSKHLPPDVLPGDSPLRSITLGELSTHRSGLPRLPHDLARGANPDDPYAHYSVERLYETLKQVTADQVKDRGETSYSNFGVGLLGHVLECIWDKPFQVILNEVILEPLGMKSTFVARPGLVLPQDASSRLATGHKGGKAVSHWQIDALCAAGAILSTAEDLARFAQAQFGKDLPDRLRAAIDLAATRQSREMGLGWFITEDDLLHHNGGTGGFHSELRVSRRNETATIQLMNSSGPSEDESRTGDFSGLAGYWSGTLQIGELSLRQILRISEAGRIVLHSIDQGAGGIPATKASRDGTKLHLVFPSVGGSLDATIQGERLAGTWSQNGDLPLVLTRQPGAGDGLAAALQKRFTGDLPSIDGWWSGYLGGKAGLFLVLEIEAIGPGGDVRFYSPDQTSESLLVEKLDFTGSALTFSLQGIKAGFRGTLGQDGVVSGMWHQGPSPQPLQLTRSEKRPKREP